MAQHVTETIWHFSGYLHIADLLGYTPVHFAGAPVHRAPGYAPQDSDGPEPALRLMLPERSRPVAFEEQAIPPELQRDPGAPGELNPIPHIAPVTIATPSFTPRVGDHAPIENGGGSFGELTPDLMVRLSYTEIPAYLADIDFLQANLLFDGDTLLGDPARLVDGSGMPADAAPILARMIADAEALVPARVFPDLAPEGDDGDVRISTGDPAPIDTTGRAGAEPETVEETSHYQNGVRVDDPAALPDANAAIESQAGQIRESIESFNPKDEAEAPPPGPATLDDGRQTIHVTTDGTPAGGYAQEAVSGANEALNVAVLDDRSDAFASLVIEGDYRETNAIVQINVLHDVDEVDISGAALARNIATGRNALTNDAHFVADPGALFGDGITGFSGALDWQVTYVTGDYWDIAALTQKNVLVDGDLVQQTSANTHMTAVLGSDGQLNFIELTQASAEYDLIVIGGDYYDLNTILQINLVMDDDAVLQFLGGPGSQGAEAGGNTLLNDAAVVSIGSESFMPLEGAPADLASTIAGQDEIVDAAMTLGVPGNGTGTLKVLYVAGDYYDLDLILQTNVIADPDAIEQAALDGADENGGDDQDELDQDAVAGANAATNLALIIDVDSLSGYQYLGGEQYEDTLLVQANIVSDDDEDTDSRDLHPDVVAAVAAMSEADDNSGHGSRDDYHDHSHYNGDVLGGVMA